MSRARLPNVSLSVTWTTFVGALEGALRALGEPHATHDLMGITGHAFRIALTERDGVLLAAPAAAAVDFARALSLYGNAGRKLELVAASPADRNFAKRREKALKQIRKTIARGRPVIAYDIHLPEFGIIYGYDDRAHTLTVSSLISGQYGDTLAEGRWPVPERGQRLIAFLVGDRRRVDPARAYDDALRFALSYATGGDPGDPTGAVHGFAAFARWRSAFEQGREIDAPGNARAIQTVQTARRDAARFLRESVAPANPAAGGGLRDAAAAYDRVALAFSRMATLFPYPAGGDTTSVAGRLVAAGALREAEEHERTALAAVESIYSR
jgi:hypothetical protein